MRRRLARFVSLSALCCGLVGVAAFFNPTDSSKDLVVIGEGGETVELVFQMTFFHFDGSRSEFSALYLVPLRRCVPGERVVEQQCRACEPGKRVFRAVASAPGFGERIAGCSLRVLPRPLLQHDSQPHLRGVPNR